MEPKLFFANERTFIHWLNMAVTISSLGAAVLAFSPDDTFAEVIIVGVEGLMGDVGGHLKLNRQRCWGCMG